MFKVSSRQAIELGNALLDAAEEVRETGHDRFVDKMDGRLIVTGNVEQDNTLISIIDG